MTFDEQMTQLTQTLALNTSALAVVAELLRQSNEGREAAMSALSATPADKPTRTPRKAKEEPAPAATVAPVEATKTATKLPNSDEVRKAFGDWMGETDDMVERENRKGFVKSLIDHFGARPAELEPEQMQQVLFFLARHRAGAAVDFNADYDFAGDPAQGATEDAAEAADDMFG